MPQEPSLEPAAPPGQGEVMEAWQADAPADVAMVEETAAEPKPDKRRKLLWAGVMAVFLLLGLWFIVAQLSNLVSNSSAPAGPQQQQSAPQQSSPPSAANPDDPESRKADRLPGPNPF
jgi:hypothetical protein